ncbi:MAG: hypothetical protein AAGI30_04670 [Planctomycetota bacterium]
MVKQITAVGLVAALASASVAGIVGFDSADDAAYDDGWADNSNGGFGFGGWAFASETSNGFAGRFVADQNADGPSNVLNGNPGRAWALFANNGDGAERSAAFRAFGTDIGTAGTSLEITLEYGFIGDGGRIGIALRHGNTNTTFNDVSAGSAAELFFEGGDANFTVLDASGEIETGAGFGFDGITARFIFTGGGAFDLQIERFFSESGDSDIATTPGLQLANVGPIQSIALFSDDGGNSGGVNSDVYFNNLTIAIPAPGSAILVAFAAVAVRRRRYH